MVTRQGNRRARWNAIMRVLSLTAALLVLAGAGASAARAADAATCAAADLLTRDGFPQRALALVATPPQPPPTPSCVAAETSAQKAVQDATLLTESAAALTQKNWAQAVEKATAALRLDKENKTAEEKKTQATAALTASGNEVAKKSWLEQLKDQWDTFFQEQLTPLSGVLLPFVLVLMMLVILARLIILPIRSWPPADDGPTPSIRPRILSAAGISSAAASLLISLAMADTYSAPLSVQMAWVVAGLNVAASMSILVACRQKRGAGFDGSNALMMLGLVTGGLAVAGLLTRLLSTDNQTDNVARLSILVLGAGVAVQAVWLLAWWLGTRIRLEVKGGADAAEVSTVVALLSELGAAKPRGLEVPQGADVTALDQAFATLPDNPILKVLKDIVRSLAGVTPWTATIEGDAKGRVVTLVRNGTTMGSTIIDPRLLELTPSAESRDDAKKTVAAPVTDQQSAPDLTLHMVAAFVLASMAPHHPSIRRGLAGATNWKSLGYHYIGSTLGTDAKAHRKELLARALEEDPENWAAKLAFRHELDRDATDSETLTKYANFLNDYCTKLETAGNGAFGIEALTLRAKYTRALILINAVHAKANKDHPSAPCPADPVLAIEAQEALSGLLANVSPPRQDVTTGSKPSSNKEGGEDDLKELKKQFLDDILSPLYLVRLTDKPSEPSSPIGMYNHGCTYASRHDVLWHPPNTSLIKGDQKADDTEAVVLFKRACSDPRNKAWIVDDPQLAKFRERAPYRTAFLAEPRTDFFNLAAIKPHADRLRASGYLHVSLLAGSTAANLGPVTYASDAVCRQIIELAQLRLGLGRFQTPAIPLDGWAVEVLDQLATFGVARSQALIDLSLAERKALATRTVKALMQTCKPKGAGKDLEVFKDKLVAHVSNWMADPCGCP